MGAMGDIVRFISDLPYYIYLIITCYFNCLVECLTRSRKDLNGETVLVTGAASGLGQNVVLKLAKRFPDAVLVLWDINMTGLQNTKEKCESLGASHVHIFVVNLAERSEVSRAAALVRQQVGPVTILYNNAGLSTYAPLLDADPVLEQRVITVNLLSYMWATREFLPDMIQRGKGHLINTSSGLGIYRLANVSAYVASKYGVRGFSDSVRLEMRNHPEKPDIKFSIVYPAWVKTPMTDGITWDPRYGWTALNLLELDYVAEEIVDGILKEKKEIMIPRSIKFVDIIHRLIPNSLLDSMQDHLLGNFRMVHNK